MSDEARRQKNPGPKGCGDFGLHPCCSSVTDLRVCSLLAPRCSPKSTRNATLSYFANTPYLCCSSVMGLRVCSFLASRRSPKSTRHAPAPYFADTLLARHPPHP